MDKSFLRKTAEIVQKHTATNAVYEPEKAYEIGTGTLLALVEEEKPETVKVFNLLQELHRLVEAKGNEQPHLIPIGERAEAIRRAFEETQLNSQEALKKLTELVRDLSEAQEQRKESKLSPEAFAVAWWLGVQMGFNAGQAERLAASVEPAFKEFSHWAIVEAHERELRKRFYREFIAAGVKEVVAWAD